MVNRSGRIGTSGETAVVKYLRANGFPQMERRRLRGAEDWGDLTGSPGLCWEVKAGAVSKAALQAARGQDVILGKWLAETERERINSHSDLGLLVLQRAGTTDAGRWFVVMDARTLAGLALVRVGVPLPSLAVAPGQEPEPVRVELRHVVRWLREAGYGLPLEMDHTELQEIAP